MRIALNIVGAIFLALGALWALQGLNVIGGSFMTGQTPWLIIGALVAIAGLALIGWANRRR